MIARDSTEHALHKSDSHFHRYLQQEKGYHVKWSQAVGIAIGVVVDVPESLKAKSHH